MRHLNSKSKRILREIMVEMKIDKLFLSEDEVAVVLVRYEEKGGNQDYETLFTDVQRFISDIVMSRIKT